VNVFAAGALLVMMRRRLGLEHVGRTIAVVLRVLAASLLAAAAAYLVWYGLDDWLGRSIGAEVVSVGAGLAAAGLVYFVVARALGVRELEALLLLRARREE
jgi:peptidoglycan biosynthesis protein MviN/MurJ (putative lipid II flippase)